MGTVLQLTKTVIWWPCNQAWWTTWKVCSLWCSPPSPPWHGSTPSSQDSYSPKYPSPSPNSSAQWPSQASIWTPSMSATSPQFPSTFWLFSEWTSSSPSSWTTIKTRAAKHWLSSARTWRELWIRWRRWAREAWWALQIRENNKSKYSSHK